MIPTVVVGPDFDGDGTKDLLVSAPAYCTLPQNCFHALYVVRESCGHFAGVIHGLEFGVEALESKSKGMHDLDVATYKAKRDGGLLSFGSTRIHVRYQFNGRAYAPTEQRTCRIERDEVLSAEVCEPWVKWRGDAGASKKRTIGTK
ncbi:integrin alpha [Polyangium sp. 6x1]|uniref:integrin alpha n=1 Tax=Polyangium sp. 6x1 TaxID=3042689 RepID=UPI002482D435|nr:integrin alpha [Polyangium sp. 6x1]MDI1442417.1 integrin alpha [Polyangium sp. 6x1]